MNIPEWFGVGLACAAALWWWRFLVRWMTLEDNPKFDPFHIIHGSPLQKDRPEVAGGIVVGTILFALTPVWFPTYLICCVCSGGGVRRVYLTALGVPKELRR